MPGGIGIPVELRERAIIVPEPPARAEAGVGSEAEVAAPEPSSFAARLQDLVSETNAGERAAEAAAASYTRGEASDLHGTMISLEKGEISFRFLASVRNRILESYREIMRMGA